MRKHGKKRQKCNLKLCLFLRFFRRQKSQTCEKTMAIIAKNAIRIVTLFSPFLQCQTMADTSERTRPPSLPAHHQRYQGTFIY